MLNFYSENLTTIHPFNLGAKFEEIVAIIEREKNPIGYKILNRSDGKYMILENGPLLVFINDVLDSISLSKNMNTDFYLEESNLMEFDFVKLLRKISAINGGFFHCEYEIYFHKVSIDIENLLHLDKGKLIDLSTNDFGIDESMINFRKRSQDEFIAGGFKWFSHDEFPWKYIEKRTVMHD